MKTLCEHWQRLGKSLRKRYLRTRRNLASVRYGRMSPSAMIIGAEKGGTTALFKYLSTHPAVIPSLKKELQFFNSDKDYLKGETFYLDYFEANTPANKDKITVDVTPEYLWAARKAAPRIQTFNPEIRLIASLRDPVSRGYSAWQMYRKFYQKDSDWYFKWMGKQLIEDPRAVFVARRKFGQSFYDDLQEEIEVANAGKKPEMTILEYGHYAEQLEIFFGFFSREQLLVIESQEMKANTRQTLSAIEAHIGIKHYDWKDSDIAPYFEGGYSEKITSAAAYLLKNYYQPHNEKLFHLLNCRFDWI